MTSLRWLACWSKVSAVWVESRPVGGLCGGVLAVLGLAMEQEGLVVSGALKLPVCRRTRNVAVQV